MPNLTSGSFIPEAQRWFGLSYGMVWVGFEALGLGCHLMASVCSPNSRIYQLERVYKI